MFDPEAFFKNFSKTVVYLDRARVFNLFCKVSERIGEFIRSDGYYQQIISDIQRVAKRAALFEFDTTSYQAVLDYASESLFETDLYYPPTMPFDPVFLLDPISLGIFFDCSDYGPVSEELTAEEQQFVLRSGDVLRQSIKSYVLRRGSFISFCSASQNEVLGWVLSVTQFALINPTPNSKTWSTIIGFPRVIYTVGDDFREVFDVDKASIERLQGDAFDSASQLYKATYTSITKDLCTAFEQLEYIDLPRHHIIEERRILTPREERQQQAGKKIPRYDMLNKYRLVTPESIRKIYKVDEAENAGERRAITPHGKRGYTRYLQSSRFVNKRWQRIRVRPSWVGNDTWDYGKLRYRVVKPITADQ